MLRVGDRVHEGDQILIAQNGIVQITDPQGVVQVSKAAPGAAPVELDRVIHDVNTATRRR